MAGDWDADGTDTIGVFRPSNATWYLRNANTGGAPDVQFSWASPGDVPVVGDWDANGTETVGVYRPGNSTFYLRNTLSGGGVDAEFAYGVTGDVPVAGDWDGDGVDTVGLYRGSDRTFYLKNSHSGGAADVASTYGPVGVAPVAGDWNHDTRAGTGGFLGGCGCWELRDSLGALGVTRVHAVGAEEPAGYSTQVEYDDLLRTRNVSDATAKVTSTTWDPGKDLVLSSTDAAGRQSSTLYDALDRPVHGYGPAPAGWYNTDRTPVSGHTDDVAHTETRYDETLGSLAVTYLPYVAGSRTLSTSGSPFAAVHATGVGATGGEVARTWGGSAPAGVPQTDGWGARLTGDVTLGAVGSYEFTVTSDDGVRLWVDDTLLVDDWVDGAVRTRTSAPFVSSVVGRHRVRVDYYDAAGTDARLELGWGANPEGLSGLVAGSRLSPRYGLVTSTAVSDANGAGAAVTEQSAYAYPENGLVTSETRDPGGLGLVDATAYEAPGAGFLRRVGATLPAGNETVYGYWGAQETPAALGSPCGSGAVVQAGRLRSRTDPDPDGTGGEVGRTLEYVYDGAGRVLGSRVGAGGWSCVVYDARGRVSSESWAAFGSQPARTVSHDYAAGGNPLVVTVSDPAGTVRVTQDLLGRTVAYSDVYGATTHTAYDRAGRVSGRSGPGGVSEFVYDAAGRVLTERLDGYTQAAVSYDTAGEMSAVGYPAGVGGPGGAATVLADAPVGFWRLGESSGEVAGDVSGGGHPGSYGGGVTLGAPGALDGDGDTAAVFDGATATVALSGVGVDTRAGAEVSVEFWMRWEGGDNEIPFGFDGYVVWVKDGAIGFNSGNGDLWGTSAAGLEGRWTHVVAVFRSRDVRGSRLFLDGEERVLSQVLGSPDDWAGVSGEARVSGWPNGPGYRFGGALDEVAVFNGALPPARVAAHRLGGLPEGYAAQVVREAPLGFWRLGESGGPVAQDASGGGRHGVYSAAGVSYAQGGALAGDTDAGVGLGGGVVGLSGLGRVRGDVTVEFWMFWEGGEDEYPFGFDWYPLVFKAGGFGFQSYAGSDLWGTSAAGLAGRWVHVAAVFHDGDLTRNRLFLDGTERALSQWTGVSYADTWTSEVAAVGGWPGDAWHRFGGRVDDVAVYDGVLGPGAVGAHRRAGLAAGGNASSVVVARDPQGRVGGLTWTLGGAVTVSDTVTRSQAGRVTAESVAATGETARFASYGYDSVGRLATADVAGHALVYGYGDQGSSCPGGASASGRNTNRTSVTDNAVTTTYCYDRADRLTATTDATVATPGYDTHGNTTTLGGGGGAHTLAYDSSDRHTTTVNGATTVGYTRDATGRVVARAATGQATLRYGYTGGGDSPDVVSDATGAPLERSVPLPGGVTVTRRGGGTEVWSYPDVHGDTVATADRTGTKQGATLAYDPYGRALAGVPHTSSGNLDYGWLGRHHRIRRVLRARGGGAALRRAPPCSRSRARRLGRRRVRSRRIEPALPAPWSCAGGLSAGV